MDKKKVIFLNNHFQYSDGTVRALIGLVNNLDAEKYDITIKPIYRCDRRLQPELRDGIKLEKAFGFYFRGFNKIINILPVKWLYKLFVDSRFDIEIAFQCGLPTRLIGYSKNKKAVHAIWMHTYDLYEDCFARADKVICVSKCNATRCKDEMKERVNVVYCYNLVDDSIITKAVEETIDFVPNQSPFLVSVGRHSPEKGYMRLVKILRELRDEGYNFNLVLVGDGPEHKKIQNLVDDLKMDDWITLVGAQINPHKYTAKADVFICSSFSEGYSTACTEAAVHGIPIITTSVAGGEEIINDCECGKITSLEDSDLKKAIKEVLDNPELLQQWKNTMQRTSIKFKLPARKQAANDLFNEFYELSEEKM